ncbi:MAG: VanW family protein [Clostridia bacterium]|nr:VanW family protein [Clostridia bacterium]
MKSRIEKRNLIITVFLFAAVAVILTGGVFLYESNGNIALGATSPNQYGFSPKMQIIGSYNTDFSTSKEDRAHNVALACESFSWLAVKKGDKLSFNNVVGKREESRGYKNAKVIVDGEYTQGVGGGVCQVSSTLYNAWVRAGLCVQSVKAHSLPSSYCPLSTDATVSEFIDLVLVNDSEYDVLVNGYTKDGKVYFDVYGHPTEYTVKLRSELIEVLPEPQPLVEWAEHLDGESLVDEEGEYIVNKKGKQGYKSRAIIEYYKDGIKVKERELRRDFYLPVQGTITRVRKPVEEEREKPEIDWDIKIF